jgi:c-di-GMP-binding flagellar brake protein YcgR
MKEWRRKYSRIKCNRYPQMNIPILLHFRPDRPDGWGIIQDISLGGIGVETRTPVKIGQTVYVSFLIAESFSFANTKGTIRRALKEGIYYICGVEFESLIDRQHLQDALAMLAENEEREKAQQEGMQP